MELEKYTQYQETKLHGKLGFAYATYLCTIPLDFDRVNLHWHDQMEVIYIKKGRGTVNLESYPVEAGCIVPVLPGELHAIDGAPDGPMEYENIIFSLSILDSTETDDWCRHHVIQALRQGTLLFDRPIRPGTAFHDAAAAALDAADRACEARPQGFALVVKSQLFMFLHALYCNRHTGPVRPLVEEAEWLKGVIFMRIFRREAGQTFVDFLTDYRLSAAVYYLKETQDEIGVVAENCGFANLSYFIRCFNRKYGASPGRYRKLSRLGENEAIAAGEE